MGAENRFKNRKARQKERKAGSKTPRPNSFLIITEGKETEPNYFNGLAEHIHKKYERSIDIQQPTIDTHGEGKSTGSLVNKALKIAARSRIIYNQTWILFDKDQFDDFDEAIQQCETGYNKNDPRLFELIANNGGLKRAIRNAEKIYKNYDSNLPPSKRDPCTKVYELLKELSPWLDDLMK